MGELAGDDQDGIDEIVGANVRACRHERGLSPGDLDRRLRELGSAMSPRVLQSIESGSRPARVSDLLALAAALRVHPVRLLLPRFHEAATVDIGGISLDSEAVGRWLTESGPRRAELDLIDPGEPPLEDLAYLASPARHEHELRKLIDRCRDIECIDNAVLRLDAEGTIVAWNLGAERLLGWRASEIIGRPIATLSTSTEPSDDTRAVLETVKRSGEALFFTADTPCKDGSTVYLRIGIAPVYDPDDGTFLGTINVSNVARRPLDVDDLVAMTPKSQAVIGVDGDGVIRYWGGAADDIYGWSADEAVGEPFTLITGKMPDPDFLERVDSLLKEGRMSFVSSRPTKSGRSVEVRIDMTAIHDSTGEIIGVVHLSQPVDRED